MAKATRGVEILMGSPIKAVVSLAIPTMVASSLHSLYNLADIFWVAGLGSNALAAVGFSFPFVFVSMAFARGLGTGGGSAISRRIGANDAAGANMAASLAIQLSIIIGAITSLTLILLAPYLLSFMGAQGLVLKEAVSYARINFCAVVLLIFVQTAVAILRSEGEAKGAMQIMIFASVFNLIADPIFIYYFDLGVRGAALATVLANIIATTVIVYQVFFRNKSFVKIKLFGVPWLKNILWDITRVGVPSMAAMAGMMVMTFSVTIIAGKVGGPESVVIFIVGWRIVNIATMPVYGFSAAATAVCGAWYGANNFTNFRRAYLSAINIALVVQILLTALIFIFAKQIAQFFTWGESNIDLVLGVIIFLQIVPWMNPASSVGWVTSAMFQGVGKGLTAMLMNILRTMVLSVASIWFLAVVLNLGQLGLWWGFVLGGIIYLPTALLFGGWYLYVNRKGFVKPYSR